MPGPIMQNPQLPSWADPKMASVTDPWYIGLARRGASLIGADDPVSQAMGIGGAMEVPELGALGKQLMTRAAAAKRAAEQGFTHDVYHGTRADVRAFNPDIMDLGIHVTPSPDTAGRAVGVLGRKGNIIDTGMPIGTQVDKGARTIPLKARMTKTLETPDMGIWKHPEPWIKNLEVPGYIDLSSGRGIYDEYVKTNDHNTLKELYEAASDLVSKERRDPHNVNSWSEWPNKFREIMQKHGYDSIAYPNQKEGVGELSYMLLHPSQARSRFARFLPQNINKGDLLGALSGTAVAGTAAGGGSNGQ